MSIESFRGPGGAVLHYRDDDFTDPWKESPIVVLAHGFGGFSALWYKWVPPLSPHFRVIRVDLRGLGLSKVPAGTYRNSLDRLTLDAIALIDHLGAKKVIWIGEHTGALVGVMLSIRVPDRLHALAVMGAPLKPQDIPAFQPAAIARNVEVLGFRESTDYMQTRGMRQWLIDVARTTGKADEFPPGYNDWYLDQMAQEDPFLYAKFRRGMIETNMLPLMKDIGVPVLWVEGDRNQVLIPAWREVVAHHPRIRLVQIPGSGFGVAYLHPEACVAEVRTFLTALGLWPA
ncbi:MAG: alpha/beta fold hydrolase [Alphaproteobacteria bacterium]|nr:alpha/beta fold hydrolase [Alphaproteobacteria bacterium]